MTTAPIRSDWVGQVIDGRYPLRQWLGGSQTSGVFLTELAGQGSAKAVLKVIPADGNDAEAHIVAAAARSTLSHPHLVRQIDSGRCEIDSLRLLYAVTEYAEEVLSQILPERPLTPAETGEMLDPVLDALSYLHRKGFVHGHLKPSNILVIDDQLKLSADSLCIAGGASRRSEGLEAYDAPETAAGTISPAADVWSLGVTIVEALTQYPPVWDKSTQTGPIVPPSIPQPFLDIARGCLHRHPESRFTLSDVMSRLAGAKSLPSVQADPVLQATPRVQPLPIVEPLPEPAPRRSPLRQRKPTSPSPARPRILGFGAAALVVVAIAVGLVIRANRLDTRQEQALRNPAGSSDSGEVVKGAVEERNLPDLLPEAQESIHGQFDVKVRVSVDAAGQVSNAELDFAGPSKYFARQALTAAQQWKFKPAQIKGRPVASAWVLDFSFTQSATDVTPVEVSP